MKEDFVEWLQEGILDGVISVQTAKNYTLRCTMTSSKVTFHLSSLPCEDDNGKIRRVL